MFAIVVITLILSLLVILFVFLLAFFSVAFADPNDLSRQKKEKEIRSALVTLHGVKVDAEESSSRTYGELFEQELVGKSKP